MNDEIPKKKPRVLEYKITYGLGTLLWVTGWVFAQGFWSTAIAICFPPWAWYLAIEGLLIATKIIPYTCPSL